MSGVCCVRRTNFTFFKNTNQVTVSYSDLMYAVCTTCLVALDSVGWRKTQQTGGPLYWYDSEAHDKEFSPSDAKHTLVVHTILSNVRFACPTGRTQKEHLTWFYRWRVQSLRMQVGDADLPLSSLAAWFQSHYSKVPLVTWKVFTSHTCTHTSHSATLHILSFLWSVQAKEETSVLEVLGFEHSTVPSFWLHSVIHKTIPPCGT